MRSKLFNGKFRQNRCFRRVLARLSILLVLLLGTAACTNNPFAWKVLYGQFDNLLNKQILGYADFDKQQEQIIRAEVSKTYDWHRKTELPLYANDIAEFQQRFLSAKPMSHDVVWLFAAMTEIGRRFDANSPMLPLMPLMRDMSDQQVVQVAEKIAEEFEEERKERLKEADKDPAEVSADAMKKFFKRVGLSITDIQRTSIVGYLGKVQLTPELQEQHWRTWSDQLVEILDQREEANFVEKFTAHHLARISLSETLAPNQWNADQELYKALLLDLFNNLNSQQIENMNKRLDKLRTVALELSIE